jgi:hypothetical protein
VSHLFRIPTATVLALALLGAAPAASAQQPAARPADVATIDGIMHAVYDVISGPAGQQRDWDRFRSLFAPGARLIPTGVDSAGKPRMRMLTTEEFIRSSGPAFERDGFFEREIGRVQERFGNIVHLFSAYDSKRTAADPQPFARGVNSFQLWWDGSRWWVLTIFWQGETPGTPIPAKYLNR